MATANIWGRIASASLPDKGHVTRLRGLGGGLPERPSLTRATQRGSGDDCNGEFLGGQRGLLPPQIFGGGSPARPSLTWDKRLGSGTTATVNI